ncbi:hypothetical protein [Polaromonas naphthalenivorans]|uniref:Rad50/SbcC-type AAA domain-containing protein n=1 Tax=Polaromonas naphthalenivorans (strain CJ2) TaxID=365044 RepID=A1VWC7_POLNA|nr:hypothetical protein [Polaromonas naphthalenivorans]ABM39955.1 conserved hypothetical protein [Polaromonas naphthalenivorans CJ2]
MAIVLTRLAATGSNLPTAEIIFAPNRNLIRGPSDTGKSYLRDCLWYMLGGDKLPKTFPESEGYQSLSLTFLSGNCEFVVHRGLAGGADAVFVREINTVANVAAERLDVNTGELLVQLSGAKGKKVLRSTSEKGDITGDDLRHWFLLSQPTVISEDGTSGTGFSATKHISSFNLFLTGDDDAGIELRKTTAEVERIKGQLSSAEDGLKRIQVGLPGNAVRDDVAEALEHVDTALSAMSSHYEARASQLKELRSQITTASENLFQTTSAYGHSASMVERFQLLDKKYLSDLQRLGASSEGIAFFQALPETPCPLCGTPIEQQVDLKELNPGRPQRYREAIAAEAEKIRILRCGLLVSLENERGRVAALKLSEASYSQELATLQNHEIQQLTAIRLEFSGDPKTLAVRRSELSAQLAIFDEMERLNAEVDRLGKLKIRPHIRVNRETGAAALAVGKLAKALLTEWGFTSVETVVLDPAACDLVIDGRARLSYGAGKRAIFLTAMTVAMLHNSLESNYPHLGVVVIDSPLKAYADPTLTDSNDVALSTVTDNFYDWLAKWEGPGQVVILENEEIRAETAKVLKPIEFTGTRGSGRTGFYPEGIEGT